MPIFAHIETEAEVQLDDRSRLDASKSHATLNQPNFTALTIQPGADSVPFNVYNTQKSLRYLDWEFSTWNIDIDSSNNKIDFQEGATVIAATLTSGTYDLPTLVALIASTMTTASVTAYTYTSSLSLKNELTISSTGGFSLLTYSGVNKLVSIINKLFFQTSQDLTGASSYKGGIIQYLSKKISTIAGMDINQVQKVTCLGDTAGSLNDKYFIIYANADVAKFYVWYNVNSAGTDPALSGYTGIEVEVATGDTATTVATLTAAAIDASPSFSATSALGVVTFTHATANWNTSALDSIPAPTGFTFLIVTPGQTQDIEYLYMNVYSEAGDYLFSSDQDLMQYEPDIRKWIVDGRNSFLNIHRQAQKTIMEWIDKKGYVNIYRKKYNKFDLIDISEVKEWARFTALRIIFEGIKNAQSDLYQQKKATYESFELDARKRAILRIDTDKSGDLLPDEGIDTASIRMAFR